MSEKKRGWRVTRRGFLIGTGVTAGAVALGAYFGLPELHLRVAQSLDSGGASYGDPITSDPNVWVEILPDNKVKLYLPKVEMGQGIHTALAQIAAEELEVAWDSIEVVQGGTHIGPPDSSGTQGSSSVTSMFTPIREMAATMREFLRAQAATQLNRPISDLTAREGGFDVAGGERVTYSEMSASLSAFLSASTTGRAEIPEVDFTLKPITEYKVIGQPLHRVDIPAKVTGQNRYGFDARMDGMLYGAVLHPPTFEAKLRKVTNADAIQAIPGVVALVQDGDFVGVVAEKRPIAWSARNQIKAEWDEGKKWQQSDIEEMVVVGGRGEVVVQRDGQGARAISGDVVEAEYRTPFAVHAPLEPQAALADVRADGVTVRVSTQFPDTTAQSVAEALGVDKSTVDLTATYLGGGYGRKGISEVAVYAARLSKAVGKPVHVGWTREEEMQNGYHRPPTHNVLRASLENGRITAMEHQQASGDVLFAFFPGFLQFIFGADFGATRGATIRYNIPNRQVTAWRRKLPVPTGSWRGLGLFANGFALESFIDEVAHKVGADPMQFRLDHAPDDVEGMRMKAVLNWVKEASQWDTPAPEGRARGVAVLQDAGTWVAQVAEVSVEDGKPRVHTIWAAMDCGVCINPDGAKAQMEGNIMWGVGSTLIEQMTIKDGAINLKNFDTYPLLTSKDAPEVFAEVVASPLTEPKGVGEPAIGPTGAAIANALFALTGTRVRQVPITNI